MSVGRICIRDVDLAEAGESVQIAAARINSRNVGTLVVVDAESRPIGIITDRDLAIGVVGRGLDPATTQVHEVMTLAPDVVETETSIEAAICRMRPALIADFPWSIGTESSWDSSAWTTFSICSVKSSPRLAVWCERKGPPASSPSKNGGNTTLADLFRRRDKPVRRAVMNDQDLKRYQAKLLELSNRTRPEISRMQQVVLEDSQAAGEHDHCTSESIDKEVALEHNEETIRNAVIAARERIDNGTYGQCLECGKRIPQARLTAIPYAPYCVDCERDQERTST